MVRTESVGATGCVWMLCSWGGSLFCDGFCVDARVGVEASEIRYPVDGGVFTVFVQVSPRLSDDVDGSFAALQGPVPYIKHLLSPTRVPFTAAYFGSLAATLYFSIGVCSWTNLY